MTDKAPPPPVDDLDAWLEEVRIARADESFVSGPSWRLEGLLDQTTIAGARSLGELVLKHRAELEAEYVAKRSDLDYLYGKISAGARAR